MPDLYNFLEATLDYGEVERDPTNREKTKLVKVLSVTRKPGGRVVRLGFNLTKPTKRELEVVIDEPTIRAIAKMFDEAPADVPLFVEPT